MKKGVKTAAVLATLLFTGTLFIGEAYAGVNQRQMHQQKRIGQGIKSG